MMTCQTIAWVLNDFWIMGFLVLAGWTTNNMNLYSAAVCMDSLSKGHSEKRRLTLVAILGTALALAHVLDHLALFLQVLAIFVGSMGAVILANFLLVKVPRMGMNLTAWAGGITFGLFNLFHFGSITSIAILDAFLGSVVIILLSSTLYDFLTRIRERSKLQRNEF